MSEWTLSRKFTLSFALPIAKFCIAVTFRGYLMYVCIFSIPYITKYICAWRCISSMSIFSTQFFFLPSVVFTINESLPKSYFFARMRKGSIIYLVFETEISNLSASFSISKFPLKIKCDPRWFSGIYIIFRWA